LLAHTIWVIDVDVNAELQMWLSLRLRRCQMEAQLIHMQQAGMRDPEHAAVIATDLL
jgi:hypothetical protein